MPVVKGGVWTNIEDEILKASVSKYGLNQWARVSSLLARKTPKQCKARWSEWLDPGIKKIEWSKEEDEKLLHLAKIMPTQWRTIAPIIGRTANQCLERYQRLLDEAEARESSDLGLAGPEGGETQAPSADDVRRLRPGELDPDPETKPARPDTIDLDEDEKEMLSEARARLANTQGKKAKRKARERQQEESRRLANLQKRRELKASGINIKVTNRKKGEMDYNADIPFERAPMPGFHDTSEEVVLNERQRKMHDPAKQQLVSKRKGDGDEDGDRKRRKNEKDGLSDSQKAAIKAGQMQKLREAEHVGKRRPLNLPTPQVGEGELDEIIKMGKMGEAANTMANASDNDATRGLVNSYSTLNSSAPIRTPRAAPQDDFVTNEIRNIRALNDTQSALLGGENTPLHQGQGSTGFEGATPRRHEISTPNPMATPLRQGVNGGVGATPGRPGQTPLRTPRDAYALNDDDGSFNAAATPRDIRMREKGIKGQLRSGLASLPKPKDTEWEFEVPDEQDEAATGSRELTEEDAAERDRRLRERREAEEALERRRRTQVMQRELPRPSVVDITALTEHANAIRDPASALIAKEAVALMAQDAALYPVPGMQVKGSQGGKLPTIDDHSLANARLMILSETRPIPPLEDIQVMFEKRAGSATLLGLGCYTDDEEQQKIVAKAAFESVQDSIMTSAEQGAKLEKKLALHLGGYQKRQKMLRSKMIEADDALCKARDALAGFQALAVSEDVAIQRRLGALRDEVSAVTTRERQAQDEYRRAREELDSLRAGDMNGFH
ncbi:pre-mRNA-splicing factor CDC5/CEF1 [Geosmithia morbida]|uniref:Pre-mRNA-splicing factor CDC5/CEF1 n=1 Tax=Geosmithia morbida TaxID=1094350 RepID=A0A9P5D405_9HYPO|nr:pre-mRNA-splicing factor CDC5/CEF1 [Geosmithia morbida]KAF4126798.1 pre-mRNA-splicing factor CDC5/CEF1 [Geosmithia morbida]